MAVVSTKERRFRSSAAIVAQALVDNRVEIERRPFDLDPVFEGGVRRAHPLHRFAAGPTEPRWRPGGPGYHGNGGALVIASVGRDPNGGRRGRPGCAVQRRPRGGHLLL